MNDATGNKSMIFLQEETRCFDFDRDEQMEAVKREINQEVWSRITTNSFHASCVMPTFLSSGLLSKIILSQSSTSCPKSSISILQLSGSIANLSPRW